jgi:hypothetical protein
MRTINFNDMRYAGRDGEEVNVTVEPDNTVQLVEYTLDGDTHPLPPGQSIQFTLRRKPGGEPTILQMTFDFTDDNGGSYTVKLRIVEDRPGNESVYTVTGPPLDGRIFRFFVQ